MVLISWNKNYLTIDRNINGKKLQLTVWNFHSWLAYTSYHFTTLFHLLHSHFLKFGKLFLIFQCKNWFLNKLHIPWGLNRAKRLTICSVYTSFFQDLLDSTLENMWLNTNSLVHRKIDLYAFLCSVFPHIISCYYEFT